MSTAATKPMEPKPAEVKRVEPKTTSAEQRGAEQRGAAAQGGASTGVDSTAATDQPQRLLSLDAYRGFIMLAMASSAFGFVQVARKPEVMERFAETRWDGA